MWIISFSYYHYQHIFFFPILLNENGNSIFWFIASQYMSLIFFTRSLSWIYNNYRHWRKRKDFPLTLLASSQNFPVHTVTSHINLKKSVRDGKVTVNPGEGEGEKITCQGLVDRLQMRKRIDYDVHTTLSCLHSLYNVYPTYYLLHIHCYTYIAILTLPHTHCHTHPNTPSHTSPSLIGSFRQPCILSILSYEPPSPCQLIGKKRIINTSDSCGDEDSG